MKLVADYAPQRTFLIQSTESAYDRHVAEMLVDNAFVHSLSVARFTTEHARTLASFIAEGTGEARIYMVFFSVFSPDAAQVLLKSLEEPDLDTTIILMTPYPYTVPATIRSRVMLIHSSEEKEKSAFDITSRDDMFAMIKTEFATDADDDAATRRARAVELLDSLESFVKNDAGKASTIYEAKKMLFAANLPTKYVLEYAVSVVL
ncbi:MAG TPA: hypothetical protein VGE18_01790 [Candidatus Paceibacterota bacterium]